MKILRILLLTMFIPVLGHAQTTDLDTSEENLPEGMQSREVDSLLHDWMVRSYLSFDDNCETTGVNPVFEDDVYVNRLERLPNFIEMPYNPVVRQYIDRYSGNLRNSVAIMLGKANFYNPIFEQALEMYQAPLELKYLPVIESALKPEATSRAGAAGLWQFMVVTGKQYGLEVTSLIDERRDPIKSSYAAARYLRDLHDIFGDWTLALAAYNCGPGNVSKAIKRAGGAADYWAIYPYLPAETRGYVPAFIAANYIMNYYCEHNICPVNTTLPYDTDTLLVNRNLRMEQISQVCDISMDELKALNPQYRTSLIPGLSHECILRMPSDKVNTFIEQEEAIYQASAEARAAKETPAVDLAQYTSEGSNSRSSRNSRSSKSSKHSGGKTVKVRSGDSLGAIARRNGTTVDKLRKLNGIKGDRIRAGQTLKVK